MIKGRCAPALPLPGMGSSCGSETKIICFYLNFYEDDQKINFNIEK